MPAVEPNTASNNSVNTDLSVAAQQVTVGTADTVLANVFGCGYCRRIVAQAAGTVFVQRQLDAAAISYAVVAGTVIDGKIVLIGGTTNHPTASAIALNLEV